MHPASISYNQPSTTQSLRKSAFSSVSQQSSHKQLATKQAYKLVSKEVKCTLVQALRLFRGRKDHRGSRGIALPFHDHRTRRFWGVSVTTRRLFTPGKDPVFIVQGVGWAPVRSGQVRNISPPQGFDPWTVQLVASRYTDYASRSTQTSQECNDTNISPSFWAHCHLCLCPSVPTKCLLVHWNIQYRPVQHTVRLAIVKMFPTPKIVVGKSV